jgi:hypothetical protein
MPEVGGQKKIANFELRIADLRARSQPFDSFDKLRAGKLRAGSR